ncbi:ADP-heptose--LPS heptosyltransferase, partial [Paraburkholderia sp. SIMBA_055]
DFTHEWRSFDDTAAFVSELDLVISVCTSAAHLAGALGVPTWLMLDHVSAWFWGEETERTPWYQTVELFRQPSAGAWAAVLDRVRARLEALTE